MELTIEFIRDDYELIVLLSNPQRRHLRGVVEEAHRELARSGWKAGDDPPEAPALQEAVRRAAQAWDQIQGDTAWRDAHFKQIERVVFSCHEPTNARRDEARRKIDGFSAETALDDEETEGAQDERWSHAPAICAEILQPVVKSGWEGPLRIELEDALGEVCFSLLFPSLSARLRFFTTDSSSVSTEESPA